MDFNYIMDKNLKFLRFCLSDQLTLPSGFLWEMNWHDLYLFACKQSLAGICWSGISRIYEDSGADADGSPLPNKPTGADVLEWLGMVRTIQRRNSIVTEKSALVSKNFLAEGFNSCVLKGQGNALMYPDPSLRTPGDIDIWVSPENADYCACKGVLAYCRKFVPKAKACYHHIDFVSAGDVEVEVHYRPSWLNNPVHNARLQKFFGNVSVLCFVNDTGCGFNRPTWEFNVVFQLCHIYNHILNEGVGLRQLVDYYYLMKCRPAECDINNVVYIVNRCGLRTVAMSVAWLLENVLGLERKYLLVPAYEKGGRFLLNEILEGGNFGKHDKRTLSGAYGNAVVSNIQRLVRDFRMFWLFPSECISEPFFRLWHFFWRATH